jgi:Bacteriocin-protection, YdeI or OmpD-Associated/Domain of unknown function (DUF1905)
MKAVIEKTSGAAHHFIRVEEKYATRFLKNGNKRVVCSIDSHPVIHCALQKRAGNDYLIHLGQKTMKQFKLKAGQIVHVKLEIDTSELQSPMPEELKAVLDTDAAAWAIFDSLSAGNKRSLVYLILQVKSIDKRIERALLVADKLKRGIKSAPQMLRKT